MVTIDPVVSEEKSFEIVDGQRRRTTEPSHPISSPGAFGSGELKHLTPELHVLITTFSWIKCLQSASVNQRNEVLPVASVLAYFDIGGAGDAPPNTLTLSLGKSLPPVHRVVFKNVI